MIWYPNCFPIVLLITRSLIIGTVNSLPPIVNFRPSAPHRPMSQSIQVTVKLFAIYQEVLKTPEIQLELPANSTVTTVLDRLIAQHPILQTWRNITQFGVNLEQSPADRVLEDGDEVVLIPPVSGG
jgi:sulfur-carrier protein